MCYRGVFRPTRLVLAIVAFGALVTLAAQPAGSIFWGNGEWVSHSASVHPQNRHDCATAGATCKEWFSFEQPAGPTGTFCCVVDGSCLVGDLQL